MAGDDITPGELARRMQDVLFQFSNLVDQVENRYVRKDLLELYKQGVDTALASVNASIATKADKSALDHLSSDVNDKVDKTELQALRNDVNDLKDTNKWLSRLVIGIIVTAIPGVVLASGGIVK